MDHNQFDDPHRVVRKQGLMELDIGLKTLPGLEATCAAMTKVSEAQNRDYFALQSSGVEDYSLGFETLMNAMDTFFGEHLNSKAGIASNYDLSNPHHLTLYLSWFIRNTNVHRGKLIDERTKSRFEEVLAFADESGVVPTIDFPRTLQLGKALRISRADYNTIKDSFFELLRQHLEPDQVQILRVRSDMPHFGKFELTTVLNIGIGWIVFDLGDAYDAGWRKDPDSRRVSIPEGAQFIKDRSVITAPNHPELIVRYFVDRSEAISDAEVYEKFRKEHPDEKIYKIGEF